MTRSFSPYLGFIGSIFCWPHCIPFFWRATNPPRQTVLPIPRSFCLLLWSRNSPSGSVDWSGMVSYAKTKKWAILGWAWNGDGGMMNMASPAWDTTATATSYSQSAYFSVIYALL